MASQRRKNIITRRRRVKDEGEEEGGSGVEELEDDSLSEGSVASHLEDDADGEGSEASDDAEELDVAGQDEQQGDHATNHTATAVNGRADRGITETEAMMNGLKLVEKDEGASEMDVEDLGADEDAENEAAKAAPTQPKQPRETLAERKRREHEEYVKERDQNPAFVPTRGGFFLHDNRAQGQWANGHRPVGRGRGRAAGPPGGPEPSDGQWAHDLHEYVERTEDLHSGHPAGDPVSYNAAGGRPPPTGPRASPPNRSFSTTVLVGNVPVVVNLPGMAAPIPYSAVPKKQHTRLPHHRPPLRRDKPVRISLPGQPPRYIFPAMDRSFIFIPRAMRPNQQAYNRGRGRGGFLNSRRGSVYGGSNYSPSIGMSRRSSLGRMSRDGMNSPAGSVYSRAPGPMDNGKPIVRLPPQARQMHNASVGTNMSQGSPSMSGYAQLHQPYPPAQNPTFRGDRPHHLPMHQPRPQKTISMADIDSPMKFPFNPPAQQEQPFHQQVPQQMPGPYMPDPSAYHPHSRHPSHPSQTAGTPLSQIPERAIHAQPFQPYYPQGPAYYPGPAPYAQGPMYYPATTDFQGYPTQPGPAAAAPSFVPNSQQVPYTYSATQAPTAQPDQSGHPQALMHEQNGTVFYSYDTSQVYNAPGQGSSGYEQAPYMPPAGGVMGMGGMMTPPGGYYYAQPQPPVYYAPQ